VHILLEGLDNSEVDLRKCVVSDVDEARLHQLSEDYPDIKTVGADDPEPAGQDVVFGALHPPVLERRLPEIGRHLRPWAIFVSLAPKLNFADLQNGLGGFDRIARMIPNAPSIIGAGFNPVAFGNGLAPRDRKLLLEVIEPLGASPEVAEEALEAYAILTAMGPTFFWFQFEQLAEMGRSFGLMPQAVDQALETMLHGAISTYFDAGLTPDEVMDLVPVKPLEPEEDNLREAYRSRLRALYGKLVERDKRLVTH